jgi:hypothetical protein
MKYLVISITLITNLNCFAQSDNLMDSVSIHSQKGTLSINPFPDSLFIINTDLRKSLHLPKKPNLSLFHINSTTRAYQSDRWKNAYNPSNSYLTKNKVTGEWVNLSPTEYQIKDAKSLLITGFIVGALLKK